MANSSVSRGASCTATASILPERRFQLGDLLDPSGMTAALELGVQPDRQDLVGQTERHDPPSHGQHVGVVVFAGEAGRVQIVAQRSPDTHDLVSGELLALAAAAEDDAPIGPALGDGAADGGTDWRVVDRLLAVGAVVVDLV